MSFDWLKMINWIDILFIIIMLRIIYIAVKRKLVVEFFKFLGILFSVFLGLHYYTRLAGFISGNSFFPLNIAKIVSFVVLVLINVLVFKFCLLGTLLLFKIEPNQFLDTYFAALISILRGVLLCSLVGLFFLLSGVNYFEFSLRQSLLGQGVTKVAIITYDFSYRALISKFFPHETLNQEPLDILIERDKTP